MISASRLTGIGLLVVLSACGAKVTNDKKPADPAPEETSKKEQSPSQNAPLSLHDDADRNGIRDAVDRHLEKTYKPGSREFKAGRQVASAAQGMIGSAGDEKAAKSAAREYLEALDCAESIFADKSDDHVDGILSVSVDTSERSKAFRKAQGHFSGSSFAIKSDEELEAACKE